MSNSGQTGAIGPPVSEQPASDSASVSVQPEKLMAKFDEKLMEHASTRSMPDEDSAARCSATAEQPRSPVERVLEALGGAEQPLSRRELRETCRLRNATLVDTLAALQADGRIRVEAGHIQLALI